MSIYYERIREIAEDYRDICHVLPTLSLDGFLKIRDIVIRECGQMIPEPMEKLHLKIEKSPKNQANSEKRIRIVNRPSDVMAVSPAPQRERLNDDGLEVYGYDNPANDVPLEDYAPEEQSEYEILKAVQDEWN